MNLQENINRIRQVMGVITENSEEKSFIKNIQNYNEYKKRWIPSDNEGELYIEQPFKFNIFLFPKENGFYLELTYRNEIIGNFHLYMDEDEGAMNDVMLLPNYRGMGMGKILLIKAMDISYSYLGGFSTDIRGITGQQRNVYSSLVKSGVIDGNYQINYEMAQEMINTIVKEFE